MSDNPIDVVQDGDDQWQAAMVRAEHVRPGAHIVNFGEVREVEALHSSRAGDTTLVGPLLQFRIRGGGLCTVPPDAMLMVVR